MQPRPPAATLEPQAADDLTIGLVTASLSTQRSARQQGTTGRRPQGTQTLRSVSADLEQAHRTRLSPLYTLLGIHLPRPQPVDIFVVGVSERRLLCPSSPTNLRRQPLNRTRQHFPGQADNEEIYCYKYQGFSKIITITLHKPDLRWTCLYPQQEKTKPTAPCPLHPSRCKTTKN